MPDTSFYRAVNWLGSALLLLVVSDLLMLIAEKQSEVRLIKTVFLNLVKSREPEACCGSEGPSYNPNKCLLSVRNGMG